MANKKAIKASRTEKLALIASAVGVFAVFATVVIMGTARFSSASYTSSSNVVAQANVLTICFTYLTPNSAPPNYANDLLFGGGLPTVPPNGISPTSFWPTNVVLVDNDIGGNANANIFLAGSNWIQVANSANTFYVTNTFWNPTPNNIAATGNALTLYNGLQVSLVDTKIQIPSPQPVGPNSGNTANVYFGLTIPFGQNLGIYVQNIIVENSC